MCVCVGAHVSVCMFVLHCAAMCCVCMHNCVHVYARVHVCTCIDVHVHMCVKDKYSCSLFYFLFLFVTSLEVYNTSMSNR